jgi:hypothetical protein
MHQRPRRDRGVGRAARARRLLGKRAGQARKGLRRHLAQFRVLRDRHHAAEHQLKALRMRECEADVGLAHATQAAGGNGFALRPRQQAEALGGEGREQRFAIRKMTIGRIVRNAGTARRLAQAELRKAFLFKDLRGRGENRRAQITVVVSVLSGF